MINKYKYIRQSHALLLCAVLILLTASFSAVGGCQPFEDLSNYPFVAATDTQSTSDDTQSTSDDTQSTSDDATIGDTDLDVEDADAVIQECTPFDPANPPPNDIPVQCFGGGNKCCPPSMECNDGSGLCECKKGKGNCDGKIVNGCEAKVDQNDRCGACDTVCAVDGPNVTQIECKDAQCLLSCDGSFADCDGLSENGCEAQLSENRAHCGACGNTCVAGQACVGGSCACTNLGLGDCGVCAQRCGVNEACDGERCVCASGRERCGGVCVDTQTSRLSCGACGEVCPFGADCVEGECRCGGVSGESCDRAVANGRTCCGASCIPEGAVCCDEACGEETTCCNESCINTHTDEAHCGACGNTCADNEVCLNGVCLCESQEVCQAGFVCGDGGQCVCPFGQQQCMSECVDLANSAAHCGACGEVCPPPSSADDDVLLHIDDATCDAGICTLTCAPQWGNCNGAPADGCEVSLADGVRNAGGNARVTHCGACGNTCDANEVCFNGACACADGFTACGSGCVNLNGDGANCGQCNSACRIGEFCRDGQCCFANVGGLCR